MTSSGFLGPFVGTWKDSSRTDEQSRTGCFHVSPRSRERKRRERDSEGEILCKRETLKERNSEREKL
jgi:hypothetical protein